MCMTLAPVFITLLLNTRGQDYWVLFKILLALKPDCFPENAREENDFPKDSQPL